MYRTVKRHYHSAILLCLLITQFVFSEKIGKFRYLGVPEVLHKKTLNIPNNLVALSEKVYVDNPSFSNVSSKVISLMFVIDNSGSNESSNPPTDPSGLRFIVTKELIEKIYKKDPRTHIGLTLFGTHLWFDPEDDTIFKKVSGNDVVKGGYIPLLQLNKTYTGKFKDSSYTKTGKDILLDYLETKQNTQNNITTIKYNPTAPDLNDRSTHINAGFEAAKFELSSTSVSKKDKHFIIFYSDGEGDYPYDGTARDYEKGEKVPTTFSVYYSKDAIAKASIETMTKNIKKNGYSASNNLSSMLEIDMDKQKLINQLTKNVIDKIITTGQNFTPKKLTVNPTGFSATNWNNTLFTLKDIVPLSGVTTNIKEKIDYHVVVQSISNGDTAIVKEYDTTHNVQFDVKVDPTAKDDSLKTTFWGRHLHLYNDNQKINPGGKLKKSDNLIIVFEPYKVDIEYPYDNIVVEVTSKNGGSGDKEKFTLMKKGSRFELPLKHAFEKSSPNDGILQHDYEDDITLTFKNPDLPLDIITIEYTYKDKFAVKIKKASYLDNNADGHVDRIFLEFSENNWKKHGDEILKNVPLPPHRQFQRDSAKVKSNGLMLYVTEKMNNIETFVTPKIDIIDIKKEITLGSVSNLASVTVSITDSVAPVIKKASFVDNIVHMHQGDQTWIDKTKGIDSLTVIFSEPVNATSMNTPFQFYNKDAKVYFATANPLSLVPGDTTYIFHVVSVDPQPGAIQPKDSIRINSEIGNPLEDKKGNKQKNKNNIRRRLSVKQEEIHQYIPYQFTMSLRAPIINTINLTDQQVKKNFPLSRRILKNSNLPSQYQSIDKNLFENYSLIIAEAEDMSQVLDGDSLAATLEFYDALGNRLAVVNPIMYFDKGKSGSKRLFYFWDRGTTRRSIMGPAAYYVQTKLQHFYKSKNEKEYRYVRDILLKTLVPIPSQ